MLVTLVGDAPAQRPPINVSLVLDRSASMSGRPLEEAKQAALRFVEFLGPEDRLSVVAFDDEVTTVFGPDIPGDQAAESIRRIQVGGSTNLSGGWLKGREHVQAGLVDGTNRIVLLTDGQANHGITELGKLAGLAGGAAGDRVTTTSIGFGPHFNEDLLRSMSDAGRGNYWYVENVDQMRGIFDEEIEGLVSLAAQNVEVDVVLSHPGVAGVSLLSSINVERNQDGSFHVILGEVYGTSRRSVGMIFHVENVSELGETTLGEVRVQADVLTDQGVEHRVITMPVVANLDEQSHVDVDVDTTLVRFETAGARERAVRQADEGDLEGAVHTLRSAVERLDAFPDDVKIADDKADLEAEAARLETGEWDGSDRKYHVASSRAMYEEKESYLRKISRRERGGGGA
jgi:Ca-activated chloride channel family protein